MKEQIRFYSVLDNVGTDKYSYSIFLRLSAWLGLIPLLPIVILISPILAFNAYVDYRIGKLKCKK